MGKGDKDKDRGGKSFDDGGGYARGKSSKGEKGGDKGGEKGDRDGKKGGKGKVPREEKVVSKGLRGKIISWINGKPSGFIKLPDGGDDVYFDLVDLIGEEMVEKYDVVEFDVIEGTNGKQYATRIKKLPKDTPLEERQVKLVEPVTASKSGSLTGMNFSLGPSKSGAGKLTGGLSLRPGGGLSLAPGGGKSPSADKKKEETKAALPAQSAGDDDLAEDEGTAEDGVEWGRIVKVHGSYGFLQLLTSSREKDDVFFRAADVKGMNCTDPGEDGVGLQIILPNGRNSYGHKYLWLKIDDEVSFRLDKDYSGKSCAVDVFKERKGAWRTGRRTTGRASQPVKKETLSQQLNRLCEMDTDQVLQNVSLFKEVLESPDFNPSHLYKIVSLLAAKDLAEDTRSDPLYRIMLNSKTMQASLRTTIIKQSSGKHCGTFVEECTQLLVEMVLRSPSPQDLRGQLPLAEIVDSWEANVREGSSSTKKGLPEDVVSNLKCLQRHFPDEVNLDRILGVRSKRQQRTAAEDYTELMEADYYQDMPVLPTSNEMLGQCAFEIQENMRTYEKCEDYIQTHFMLLREDYIEPLRAGIKLYMQGKHSPKDLHVYAGVKVVGVLSTWEGLVYRIELRKDEIRRVNWEKTKQLMYGSLLCFSDDEFETLIWATVWRRDEHLIANEGQLDVRLPFEPYDDRLAPGKSFCCIENVTIYFEAYRYVLIALQSMRPHDVPFQDTLLSPQPEPAPPAYVKAETDMWHFHNVFHSCEKVDSPVAAVRSFKILHEWPESLQASLDIDPSQLDAIQHALTHQMALIQGPPGTGKTWVGLKIVQALLENTAMSRHSPILVVCYTNHALDQFLEGIYRFNERITRIGSRSKSEVMMQRNLKELVGQVQPSREYFHARKGLLDRRDTLREQFVELLETVDRHTVELVDAREILGKGFDRFYDGFLEYMGEDAKKWPQDSEDLDDEQWTTIMKEWLEMPRGDLTKLAPVIPKAAGGLPSAERFLDDEDEDGLNDKRKEIGNDGEEDEAAQERDQRKLDDQEGDDKKKQPSDFCVGLKNAWLPFWEEHYDRLRPELRSLSWRDEDDLWMLSKEQKRETYRQWMLEAHHETREALPEIARQLERNAESRAALERDRKLALLREMEVVGMTTTAVSKYQVLLKELRPEVVIVEEAAEVLEAHILTALHPRTQHVILIGDHQQLRPSTAVYRLSKNFHLDVSLFERLIRNGADHVTLLQQRRMHPKISRLIKPLYPLLRDHPVTSSYPDILGVNARCFFMKHSHLEDDEGESHSKANTFEGNFISAFTSHLIKSGYDESKITVLSPYLGQVRLLKNKLRRDPATESVQVTAVDNFQGEENDIIIISLVRSNKNRSMGFLAVENRINVALTRARHGMFIIGNADMLKGHTLWSSIMSELATDQCISDRLPLLDPETGGLFEVKSSDEISVILGDPRHQTGDFGGMGDGKIFNAVADRWAELGKEEHNGKGKGKGKRAKEELDAKSKSKGKGKDRGKEGSGGVDRSGDDKPSKRRSDRNLDGDVRGRERAGGNDAGHKHGMTSSSKGKNPHDGRQSSARDEEPQSWEDLAGPPTRPAPAPAAPPPARLEADGIHDDCELMKGKGDDEEDENSKTGKKAGKKKKKGDAAKVVMRWG